MTAESKVFLSYASQDRALAEEIVRRLRPMAAEVWFDEQLSAGENWGDVLQSRLRASQYFVLVLTPKTLESPWVLQELGAAWALGKRIVSVVTDRRLMDRLPVELGKAQTITVDEMDKLGEVLAA